MKILFLHGWHSVPQGGFLSQVARIEYPRKRPGTVGDQVGHRTRWVISEDRTLPVRLTIDRFEGTKKDIAVLLTDDGDTINFPKSLLPKGVKAGDILSFTIEMDAQATRKVAEQTRSVQEDLKKTDTGRDVKL